MPKLFVLLGTRVALISDLMEKTLPPSAKYGLSESQTKRKFQHVN